MVLLQALTLSGVLGKAMSSYQLLEVINFKQIEGDLPEIIDYSSLSKDIGTSMRCVWLLEVEQFRKC